MEKKKKILFAIIVIVLLFAVLGVCYVVSKKGENNEVTTDEKVKNEVSEKEETDELENVVENEINVDDEEVLEIGVTNKEKTELEENAKKILNSYLPLSYYEADTLGAMPYLLVELELIDSEDLDKFLQNAGVTTRDYIKTTIKYNDFKNAMLEYISEEYFNKYFKLYKNS